MVLAWISDYEGQPQTAYKKGKNFNTQPERREGVCLDIVLLRPLDY